ncbi:DUF4099 domain-containing protein [Pedobacter sp. GR22-6]|uniref:DUF4099 domain-containing protein n=1 Tax=Pedobacter sp. GR22-6 TaxID=3127957 RepID=UPI00307EBAB7
MNIPIIQENDPRFQHVLAELQKLGLANDGKLHLSKTDREALLSGGRTDLISLHDLKSESYRIDQLDAKLSLSWKSNGEAELKLHPIYKEASYPPGLTDEEAQQLQVGQTSSILKRIKEAGEQQKDYLFEFDPDTREFIKTETGKVKSPDLVNGEKLNEQQKQDYQDGKEVELSDGTRFKYSGVETQGIRSDKAFLLASVFLDGGLTYVIYHGLKALNGLRNTDPEALAMTKGFINAKKDMESAAEHQRPATEELVLGYSRTGRSR